MGYVWKIQTSVTVHFYQLLTSCQLFLFIFWFCASGDAKRTSALSTEKSNNEQFEKGRQDYCRDTWTLYLLAQKYLYNPDLTIWKKRATSWSKLLNQDCWHNVWLGLSRKISASAIKRHLKLPVTVRQVGKILNLLKYFKYKFFLKASRLNEEHRAKCLQFAKEYVDKTLF